MKFWILINDREIFITCYSFPSACAKRQILNTMNILMMTNTFTPQVGGVARSVQSFTERFIPIMVKRTPLPIPRSMAEPYKQP